MRPFFSVQHLRVEWGWVVRLLGGILWGEEWPSNQYFVFIKVHIIQSDIGKRPRHLWKKRSCLSIGGPGICRQRTKESVDFEKTSFWPRQKRFCGERKTYTQTLPPPHHTTVKERSSWQTCHAPTVLFRKQSIRSTAQRFLFLFLSVCLCLCRWTEKTEEGCWSATRPSHLHPPTYIHIYTHRHTQVEQAKRKKKSCTLLTGGRRRQTV